LVLFERFSTYMSAEILITAHSFDVLNNFTIFSYFVQWVEDYWHHGHSMYECRFLPFNCRTGISFPEKW